MSTVRTTSNLTKVLAAARAGARAGVEAWGLLIESDAKRLVPVRTGNLRRSIQTRVDEPGSKLRARVGPGADYGVYVELGTRRMAPRPYLRPAADMNRDRGPSEVRRAVLNAIRAFGAV